MFLTTADESDRDDRWLIGLSVSRRRTASHYFLLLSTVFGALPARVVWISWEWAGLDWSRLSEVGISWTSLGYAGLGWSRLE